MNDTEVLAHIVAELRADIASGNNASAEDILEMILQVRHQEDPLSRR